LENQLGVANLFLTEISPGSLTEYLLFGRLENGKSFRFIYDNETSDEPYDYHINLIKVIIQSIKGDEALNLNLNKVQSIFKIKGIIRMMNDLEMKKEIEKNERKKINLRELQNQMICLLNEVYLLPKRINIEKIFKYAHEFSEIFERECRNLSDLLEQVSLKDGLEFKYIFSILIPFLINYHNKFLSNEIIYENLQKISKKSIIQLIQIILFGFQKHLKNLNKNQLAILRELHSSTKTNDDMTFLYELEKKNNLEEENKIKVEKKMDSLKIIWENTLQNFLNSKILSEVKLFFFSKDLNY
jgi:hypothetical protein